MPAPSPALSAPAPRATSTPSLGSAAPASATPAPSARERLNLRWLLWLRASATALLTIAGVGLLAGGSPLWKQALVSAGLVAAGGMLLRTRAARGSSVWVLGVLVGDVALLTAALTGSGGAANPFSGLYLFLVLCGALVLNRRGTWLLLAVCGAAYSALFAMPGSEHAHHAIGLHSHLVGMLLVFALLGPFTALAVSSLRRDIDRLEATAAEAVTLRHRNERLSSLATLVTGAAHELNTPLGTISLVAHELHRRTQDPGDLEDLALIGDEVDRCIAVLEQMSADAGRIPGEGFQRTTARGVIDGALGRLAEASRVRVDVDADIADVALFLPARQVSRALRGLLDNALLAAESDVALRAARDGDDLCFVVADRGPGMPPDVLARAGDPFFTTRDPGEGMGLGLYFARSLAEGLGGGLSMSCAPTGGTTATLRLPISAAVEPESQRD